MIFMAEPRFTGRYLSVGAAFSLWTSCCNSEERLGPRSRMVSRFTVDGSEIWRENQLIW